MTGGRSERNGPPLFFVCGKRTRDIKPPSKKLIQNLPFWENVVSLQWSCFYDRSKFDSPLTGVVSRFGVFVQKVVKKWGVFLT